MSYNDSLSNINIERTVLSSILFEYEVLESVSEKLKAEMFYLPAHQKIYEVMISLYKEGQPVDEEFIRRRVSSKDVDDSILLEIISANPISDVSAYAELILESYTHRELLSLATLIKKESLEEGKKTSTIIELLNTRLEQIENLDVGANDIRTLGEWDKVYENEPELDLLPTGISWVDSTMKDEETGKKGFELGSLIFLSGKKETGKTYLATTIMENMASMRTDLFPEGIKCGFFSMEFGTKHYRNSVKKKYKHQDNAKRVSIFKNVFVEHRVNEISDIEKKVKKMVKKGVKFIFIDSQLRIQNSSYKNATKAEKLADIFSRIGILAQKYEIVIMIVVQTSKADHDAEEVSVKGCIDADHEARTWIHITKEKQSELRNMLFAKNKQNFMRPKIQVKFNAVTHEFKKVITETKEGIPITYEDPKETVFETNEEVEASTEKHCRQMEIEGLDILN